MILADIAQLSTSQCLLLKVFFKYSLYFTIYVGLHTMSSPSFTIVNRVNRGFRIMNPSDGSATSSSSKFFQGFDRFLKKQGGKGATTSSSTTTVSERFSSQFDKQFGKPLCPSSSEHSSSTFSNVDNTAIVEMLTRDPETQKPVEIRQQEFARSLKAREIHLESTRKYNQEQDLLCHGVGVHPDSYKLPELGDDSRSSGYNTDNTYMTLSYTTRVVRS